MAHHCCEWKANTDPISNFGHPVASPSQESEKDKVTMSTPVFEKDLTGLLVVDPYNDFISEGGILWPLIKEIAESVNCVPNMLATLQAARAAGIPVFFAPHHRDRGPDDESNTWKYIAPIQTWGHDRHLFAAGSWGGTFRDDYAAAWRNRSAGTLVLQRVREHRPGSPTQEARGPQIDRDWSPSEYLHRLDSALRRRVRI